jgi:hypothetical protein
VSRKRPLTLRDHLKYQNFRNQNIAQIKMKFLVGKYPDVYWRIRSCRWMDNGKHDTGNPHFHVVNAGQFYPRVAGTKDVSA